MQSRYLSIVTSCTLAAALCSLTLPARALELRYGQGEFDMGMSISPLFNANVTLDTNVWTLAEPYRQIGATPFHYHFKLDYFDSDTLNAMTDLASLPLTTPLPFPFSLGSFDDYVDEFTTLPVPADYRLHGVNFDVGLGYEVWKTQKSTLGLGVNAGVSMPFMKTRHLARDVNTFIAVLEDFNTEVTTWKFGPTAYASHQLVPGVKVRGSAAWNYQTASMDNDWLGSGIDIDGSNVSVDVGAQLDLATVLHKPQLKNVSLSLGYAVEKWDYDSTQLSTPVRNVSVMRPLDFDFEHRNLYVGIGYQF